MNKHQPYRDRELNEAVEELAKYNRAKKNIAMLSQKRTEAELEYTEIKAVRYDKLNVQGGKIINQVEETAIRWAELDYKIKTWILECQELYTNIERKLMMMREEEADVLRYYYIEGITIDKISRKMSYSNAWVRATKSTALKHYSEI